MQARPLATALASLVLGCFDPPELDRSSIGAPITEFGTDTWPEADESNEPSDSDPGSGPSDSGASDSGPSETGDDTAVELDPALAQLRLTEVLADPDGPDGGADSPEFVEILNPGPSPVNLSGLVVAGASWPELDGLDLGVTELELPVGGTLVIQRWVTDVEPSVVGVEVLDGVVWIGFQHSGGLRNADGTVVVEAGGLVIDQLVYGPDTDVEAPGSGVSLCRVDPKVDAWSACGPTPGALAGVVREDPDLGAPTPILAGALQIVEVSANPPGPASDEKAWEYVEIINLSETSLELVGLRVGDDPSVEAAGVDPLEVVGGDGGCGSPTCLAPGGRAILVAQGHLGDVGSALVLTTDDSTIADGGLTTTEPVVLWGPDGALISSYRLWPDPAGEPLASEEQPLHRIDPLGADEPSNWVSAPATPGL